MRPSKLRIWLVSNRPHLLRHIEPTLLLFVSAALLLSACGMKASRSSFATSLDKIDALMASAAPGEALKELSKAQKYAGDPFSRLGIFRRYMALGEKVRAERAIKSAIRRFRDSQELKAVYAHFLLREGRVDDAAKVAKPLAGTAYGSVYSEVYLTQLFIGDDSAMSGKQRGERPSYTDDVFFPIYYDAYTGTHLSYWLRNCALIRLMQGNYAGAMGLSPDEYGSALDAYFWALASFDNKQFGRAAYLAALAKDLYDRETADSGAARGDDSVTSEGTSAADPAAAGGETAASVSASTSAANNNASDVSALEITAILSDAYMSQGDDDSAELARQSLLAELGDGSSPDAAPDEVRDALLPVIYLNSALYAQSHGDDARGLQLLHHTVDTWRDYVPALIAYSAFARRTSEPLPEDMQETALRTGGLSTLRMEKYDNRPRVAVSDARKRMEDCLARTYDPVLYIALVDLRYATDKTLTRENKVADVWGELEKSATGTNKYPPMLLEFAVNKLLNLGEEADAWTLFAKSLASTHAFDPKHDFWAQCVEKESTFTVSEAEFAAYFAALAQNADAAKALLNYCVYSSGGVAGGGDAKKVSTFVSTPTCMNLGMVCSSTGEKRKALDVYAAATGRAANVKDKAEAMRRMAAIYVADGRMKEARKSIGYALSLDPHNMKAKLLLDRLTDPPRFEVPPTAAPGSPAAAPAKS